MPLLIPDLSRFRNDKYFHGRNVLIRTLWVITEALVLRNPVSVWSLGKVWVLRAFGAKIGKGTVIKPSVSIKHPWFLEIGDHVWLGEHLWIDNLARVRIGSHACLSQGAMLLTGNHDYKAVTFDFQCHPIVIEDGAWVGAQATVCPGVTVGRGAVLAVGSIATKDLEPFGIYQGNPAQKVRARNIAEKSVAQA